MTSQLLQNLQQLAAAKAKAEFSKYKGLHKDELSPVETEFIKAIDTAEKKLTAKKK